MNTVSRHNNVLVEMDPDEARAVIRALRQDAAEGRKVRDSLADTIEAALPPPEYPVGTLIRGKLPSTFTHVMEMGTDGQWKSGPLRFRVATVEVVEVLRVLKGNEVAVDLDPIMGVTSSYAKARAQRALLPSEKAVWRALADGVAERENRMKAVQ